MKRALLSVYDKTGIVDFAKELSGLDFEIISTGGTFKLLTESRIENVIEIDQITGFPEMLDGRVKTLHPKIHGGLLAMRDNPEHMRQIAKHGISPIDIVVNNLYPFRQTILKDGVTLADAIENIDIGGPSMLRAAAKNYQDVSVIVDPSDYNLVLAELKQNGKVAKETNFKLCAKVFEHTAHYDALIADYLRKQTESGVETSLPNLLTLTYERLQNMSYGENPHQKAAFYREVKSNAGDIAGLKQIHGKELSFNNINDTHGALELLKEFDEPAAVACKHANPCGVGTGTSLYDALKKALESDPVSVYGGIIVLNREVDGITASLMSKILLDIVLAPSFTPEAEEILKKKKNTRLIILPEIAKQSKNAFDFKKVSGGLLVQSINSELLPGDLNFVTKRKPTEKEIKDLLFAWKIVKHTKSNAIAIGKNGQSVGLGVGQVNRIWACQQAIEHGINALGKESLLGAALASDAYFPFSDCVLAAAEAGVTAIIQPGGSIRDQESIDACDEKGVAMVFTGMRHFRH